MMPAELYTRYPALESIRRDLERSFEMLVSCYEQGGTVYLCGNGGSASDCEHIVGELMKSFQIPRPLSGEERSRLLELGEMGLELTDKLQQGLPAVSLASSLALNTAMINDVGGRYLFAQQIQGYGKPGDVLVCLSTSGNSENILLAAVAARARGVGVLALSGRDGGKLAGLADVSVICPSWDTAEIQEYHLPIYHALCAMLEQHFFAQTAPPDRELLTV